ncbi:MAG: hypothetical protein OHK0038_08140 [Flammeovirgaceae bacterium]
MISLPSLEKLFQEAVLTLRRFPFVLSFACLATILSIWVAESTYRENIWQIVRIIMSCGLAALLCLSIVLLSEKQKWGLTKNIVYQLIGIGFIFIYYWLDTEFESRTTFLRFGLLCVFAHLLVAIAPYLFSGEKNGFWQYNQQLFIRILLSALYTFVLYAGLTLAMVAIETLFGVNFGGKIFLQLWIFLLGIFNTWFFLSGVPSDFEGLEKDESYPKGLKLFTQFVLLPLIVIYFLILYVYSAKILIEWDLPKGWVSWLVLCLSVAGIFSLLLIEPIKNKEENSWIKQFSRAYYFAIFPLVVLLCVSIWKRVSEYGITEPRYLVIVLAIWLTGISIYFLMSKEKNIRWIPISLSVVVLLSAYSPFNAFVVSRASQLKRLEDLADKNGYLKSGKFIGYSPSSTNLKDVQGMMSILDYFDENKDLKYCQPMFYFSIDSLELLQKEGKNLSPDTLVYCGLVQRVAQLGGFYTPSNTFAVDEDGNSMVVHYFYLQDANSNDVFEVKGYDYSFRISFYEESFDKSVQIADFAVSIDSVQLHIDELTSRTSISLGEFSKALMKKAEKTAQNYEYLSREDMTFETENERFKLKIYCNDANITRKGEQQYFSVFNAQILIAKIPEK